MKKANAWIIVIALITGFGLIAQSRASAQTVDIWKAAASGNMEAIKQHLEAGIDVDTKERLGPFIRPKVQNEVGREVGHSEPVFDLERL